VTQSNEDKFRQGVQERITKYLRQQVDKLSSDPSADHLGTELGLKRLENAIAFLQKSCPKDLHQQLKWSELYPPGALTIEQCLEQIDEGLKKSGVNEITILAREMKAKQMKRDDTRKAACIAVTQPSTTASLANNAPSA
jgi:hypothetical protein